MKDSHLAILIIVIFVVSVLVLHFSISNWFNEMKAEQEKEKQSIIDMDCAILKSHIIKDDLTWHSQSYLETQFKWRCEN